jgi:hypothetical protein
MFHLSPDAFHTHAFMAFKRHEQDNAWFKWASKLSFNTGGKAKCLAALGTYLFGSSEALNPDKADKLIGDLGK